MKTMCHPSYHHNGFVATHALGQMMYRLYIYIIITVKLTSITFHFQCKTLFATKTCIGAIMTKCDSSSQL